MDQIIYALIARGSLVLCEYTESEGDFPQLIRKTLLRVKKSEGKQMFSKENYLFCVLCHQEYKFFCMVEQSYNKDSAFQFLENIKTDFLQSQSKDPNFNSAKYASRLQLFMKQNQNQQDVVTLLEQNIESLNDQADKTLTKLMEREVKLDILVEQAKNLSENADLCYHHSRKLKNHTQKYHSGMSIKIKIFIFLLLIVFSLYTYSIFNISV